MDINEVSSRLADIQGQLFQLMQMIEPGKLIVDALPSGSGSDDEQIQKIEVTGGYVVISAELGVFCGNGVAAVEFVQSQRGKALRVLSVEGQRPPERLILQLNVEYAALRGRNLFDVQARWTGSHASDPTLEVRLFGDNGVIKREAVDCYLHQSGDTFSLRAPVQLGGSIMRSQTIHQAQFCLSFNTGIYGAEFTTLKVM